jgi:colanic acid/amylovoran biosynthesis protein
VTTYAVIGGTLWGNRGAEAMVVTTIGRVRERDPGARFVLLSYMAGRDAVLVEDPDVEVVEAGPRAVALVHLPAALLCWLFGLIGVRVPNLLLPSSVATLRRCRALFDVTGISFHDGRLAVVAYNLLCLWPALLLGVPVVRLSQAMGPFRHPLNRWPARFVTARSFHTFARGRLTAELVRGLRVPDERWSIAADVAFAYRPTDSITSENEDRVAAVRNHLDELRAAGTDVIALVPSSLVLKRSIASGSDHVGQLHQLVRDLQARGRHVLLMPNATSAGLDTLRNNDIAVIEQVMARIASDPQGVDPQGVSAVDFDLNTAAIRSLIERCELVITSRFHAMVAALALGVPTLVLGWSHKYEEVLEMFGCAEDAVDFEEAEGTVLPMVDRLLADADATRERILAALPAVVASAEGQFDVLDRLPPARRA